MTNNFDGIERIQDFGMRLEVLGEITCDGTGMDDDKDSFFGVLEKCGC